MTNTECVEFLNAVAKSDPNGLWEIHIESRGGIARSGPAGSHVHTVKAGFERKPVVGIIRGGSWTGNAFLFSTASHTAVQATPPTDLNNLGFRLALVSELRRPASPLATRRRASPGRRSTAHPSRAATRPGFGRGFVDLVHQPPPPRREKTEGSGMKAMSLR